MSKELPPSWVCVPLSKVGIWGSGGTPTRADGKAYGGDIPWLKIGDLTDGLIFSSEEKITQHGISISSAKLLPANTLLIAMYGSIGKLGITTAPCATNQAIASCKPYKDFDLKYLFYLLMNERQKLIDQGQGGTQLNISQTIIRAHQVNIAPLEEQKLIVSKIEELFSRISGGEASIQKVNYLLGTPLKPLSGQVGALRQSVLNLAFSGQLVAR